MGKTVSHFEIGCRDIAKTKAFYATLFGWQIQPPGPSAAVETENSAGIDGHITSLGHKPHNYVTIYVQVEDLQATLGEAERLGGRTLVKPMALPDGRRFAWLADPDGNTIGIITAGG
jgi:predicted enzyme related to lactoylglutathione lyase